MENRTPETFTYLSADGHNTVQAYLWTPAEKTPRGIIQLSHGMQEYVCRYASVADVFTAAGFVFCGNDHLGHGHTAANAEELGFTAKRGGADLLVEDVHTMTQKMKERYPGLPVILYGHSMGSFVARLYLTRYAGDLAGALISGTSGPGQPTGMALALAHLSAAFHGDHHRSKLLTSLSFGSYNKHFKEENNPLSWLTRDNEVRAHYADDPLCSFMFTTGGYDTLFSLLSAVSRKEWAEKVPRSLPILLLSGDEDPVGQYGKGVRKVYENLIKTGHDRVTLKLYAGGRHEMHNEINREEVFADMLAFFNTVCGVNEENA